MAYTDAATTAKDAGFQDKVRAALYNGCARIGGGSFVNDQQKAYFTSMMHQVVAQPDLYVTAFAWTLAAHSGITLQSTDADIDTAITALWPAVSGYLAASS